MGEALAQLHHLLSPWGLYPRQRCTPPERGLALPTHHATRTPHPAQADQQTETDCCPPRDQTVPSPHTMRSKSGNRGYPAG